jgi:hypothetical protein
LLYCGVLLRRRRGLLGLRRRGLALACDTDGGGTMLTVDLLSLHLESLLGVLDALLSLAVESLALLGR